MANCKFIYKGHRVFDSELELDEFIINSSKYKQVGDEVFELDTSRKAKIEVINKTDEIAQKILSGNIDLYNFEAEGFPDYISQELDKGNYAVTAALKMYRDDDGNILFPLFNSDNYWAHKLKDWERLEYWTTGIRDRKGNIIQAGEEEIKAVFGDIKREDITKIPTKAQMNKGREVVSHIWVMQSFMGSSVHRMFRFFWDYVHATHGNVSDRTAIRARLVEALNYDLVRNPKSEDLKKFIGLKYSDIIKDSVVDDTLDLCLQTYARLKREWGDDIEILPEKSAMVEIPDFMNPGTGGINLVGNMDLIVLDSKGNTHIIDYKTSPKPYSRYNSAKIRTYHYQLATYQRMLQKMGIAITPGSTLNVIPIRFDKFNVNAPINFDPNNQEHLKNIASFDHLKFGSEGEILQRIQVSGSAEYDTITRNLQEFIPIQSGTVVDDTELLGNCKKFITRMFPMFGKANQVTKEWVDRKLKSAGADKPNKNTKQYEFTVEGDRNNLIRASSYEELLSRVYAKYQQSEELLSDATHKVKELLHEAKANDGKLVSNIGFKYNKGDREDWLKMIIERYGNANYQILDTYQEALDRLGIILLQNTITRQIDVLAVDTSHFNFTDTVYLGGDTAKSQKRTTITGTFVNDVIAKNKPQSLIMDSTYGNVRLMEVMAALNQMGTLFSGVDGQKAILGEITLISRKKNVGFSAPNEQLMYNFNELCKEATKADKTPWVSNFGKTIKVAKYLDLMRNKLSELVNSSQDSRDWYMLRDCKLATDPNEKNPIILKQQILEVVKEVEERYNLTRNTKGINLYGSYKEAYRFVHLCYSAIAELDGIKFKQQIADHDKVMNQQNISEAIKNGWSGNSIDNPGMLDSDILNIVGKRLNVAYQNTRDEMIAVSKKLQELTTKLKQEKNFGYLKSRTLGSEAALYKNMYQDKEDDLLFKNPFDESDHSMSDTEREVLKYSLFLINKDRLGISTVEDLIAGINTDPHNYLKVPLTRGTTDSKIAYKGMWKYLKEVFDKINPFSKKLKQNIREEIDNVMVDEQYLEENDEFKTISSNKEADNRSIEHWQMTNEFQAGNYDAARAQMISERGVNYFERNLELLTMKHCFAYTLKDKIDGIFPILKACALQLEMQGVIMNSHFAEDIQYLHDFITAKVLNLSIEKNKWKQLSYFSSKLMSGASKLALAFNPQQLYQNLEGIWKDISLVIRKPDGTEAFTSKHMKDAFMWVYSSITHNFGDKKSLARLLNEQYGINDMDMNSYVQKTRPNQFGIWNMDNIMFHFASRPDFYNRMTIFVAHMKADGCFDAYDKEGNYDWTKDKRYEVFAKYYDKESEIPESLKETYKKQKALYHTVAEQFVAEGATYTDTNGNEVQFDINMEHPKPLPRAYTVQEAESIKSVADMTYGYYSHEKRALFQSTTLGALFMQMNTYWSSKKNQWMAPGGIRMQGKMVHYHEKLEDGSEQYFYCDEDGNPTTEITDRPFMVWQGQYQEGIIVTLAHILDTAIHGDENGVKGLKNAYLSYYNNSDDNLRQAYRNNLRQLWYDLLMLFFMGMIVAPALENAAQKHAKDTGNGDLGQAMINNTMLNLTAMLSKSTDDFNMAKAIFGRGMQWTPFSISTMTNTAKRISSLVSGNSDLYDTLIKVSAATRSQESLFDYIKINSLGREIGDTGRNDE